VSVRTAVALALACLLALAACGGGKEEPELQAGVLRLGAVPGPTAADAEVLNGLRAAVREVNRAGGIDERVQVRLFVGSAARLAEAGVRVVVLPCDARLQAASAAVLKRRTFLLEPCNTAVWRRFPAVWPVSVSPADEAGVLVGYARDQGYERLGVVGEGRVARAVRAAAMQAGLELAPLRRSDAVVVALRAPFAQSAVARLRERGIDVPVLATHGLDDRAVIAFYKPELDGVVFTTYGFPDPGSQLDEVYERYRALTGHRPASSVATLGYDAVQVLRSAVHDAASTRPAALATVMPGLDASGGAGRIEYPERGGRDPHVSVAIVEVEHGRLVLVDRVGV
jgi:ABC-type branched-subunit amino acid transport system substrate-binding protein